MLELIGKISSKGYLFCKSATLLFFACLLNGFLTPVFAQSNGEVEKLNKKATALIYSKPDSAAYYADQSILLARKINFQQGLADALVLSGHVDYFKGVSGKAKSNFDEAIKIYEKIHSSNGLAIAYIQYGRMYNLLAEYDKALYYLNRALSISKKAGDEKMLTDVYKNIGIVYFSRGELSKSMDYYYQGLFLAIKNHYNVLSAELYNDIGVIFKNMEVYPNSLEYFKKSLGIFKQENDIQAIGMLNQNVGEVLLKENRFDDAIPYFIKSNSTVKKQHDQDGLSAVYTDLGICYAHSGNFGQAIRYMDTSLFIAKKYHIIYNEAYAEIGFATIYNQNKLYRQAYPHAVAAHQLAVKLGNLAILASAAMQLNETLNGLGKINEAYKSLKEYIAIKNSLKDNESIQKLTSYNYNLSFSVHQRLQAQEQKDRDQIYKQTVRSQRLTILIFFVLIIAMLGTTIIYYTQKKKQLKINESLDEQTGKLNDLNTLKDRLIAILAHDLRAPLSTLRGLFDLLQDDTITHQQLLEMIPQVLKKLEHTSDFLDTLLFWINSQMENFQNTVKNVSVNEIVIHELKQYSEPANRKGIMLTGDVDPELIAIADPNSVRIVLRNLITNAIKFCSTGDQIEVSAHQELDQIFISVRDTGVGMTAEQSARLFKGKVDSKMGTQKEAGTGMGLLFCKDLVENSNGKIWVQSELSHGSKFTFTVPVAVKHSIIAAEV